MAEEEKKDLLGSETIDRLYSYLEDTTQSIYQRAQEDDPTSLTDEAARLGVGTAEFVGNVAGAPVIKQTLQLLDLPFYLARQGTGGLLEHGFGVDPRVGHLAVGTAEVFVGGKGLVSGATKGAKLVRKGAYASRYAVQETIDAARAARLARKGKFWRSPDAGKMSPLDDAWKPGDITGPKKTYTQTAPRRAYPDPKSIPPDPWNPPDLQAHLFDYIDSTKDIVPPANPSVDDLIYYTRELSDMKASLIKEAQNPNIPLAKRIELAKTGTGYTAAGWYEYPGFRKASSKMAGEGRPYLQSFQSPQTLAGQDRAENINIFKKENLPKLREEFSPALEALKIKGGAQIHHIAALKATAGIYHKTQYMSPLYREITNTLLEELPGLGDMKGNLLGVVGSSKELNTPHGIVHKFYADKIGESGELFFTDDVLERMTFNKQFRLRKARELAQIIKHSEEIVKEAQQVFKDLYSTKTVTKGKGITVFDDFVERLSRKDEFGLDKLIDPDYQLPDMQKIVKEIASTKGKPGPKPNMLKKIDKVLKQEGIDIDPQTGKGTIQGNLFDQ